MSKASNKVTVGSQWLEVGTGDVLTVQAITPDGDGAQSYVILSRTGDGVEGRAFPLAGFLADYGNTFKPVPVRGSIWAHKEKVQTFCTIITLGFGVGMRSTVVYSMGLTVMCDPIECFMLEWDLVAEEASRAGPIEDTDALEAPEVGSVWVDDSSCEVYTIVKKSDYFVLLRRESLADNPTSRSTIEIPVKDFPDGGRWVFKRAPVPGSRWEHRTIHHVCEIITMGNVSGGYGMGVAYRIHNGPAVLNLSLRDFMDTWEFTRAGPIENTDALVAPEVGSVWMCPQYAKLRVEEIRYIENTTSLCVVCAHVLSDRKVVWPLNKLLATFTRAPV